MKLSDRDLYFPAMLDMMRSLPKDFECDLRYESDPAGLRMMIGKYKPGDGSVNGKIDYKYDRVFFDHDNLAAEIIRIRENGAL